MKDPEKARKWQNFINEYESACSPRNFVNTALPTLPPLHMPTITLPREQFVKFRNDYWLLTNFAAEVCGIAIDELCHLDLLALLMKRYTEENK